MIKTRRKTALNYAINSGLLYVDGNCAEAWIRGGSRQVPYTFHVAMDD